MSFELAWHDLLGALGSLMIIAAFFFLQIEKLKSDTLSYSLLNGFLWAIPVLGFIGTVLGLGNAIGAFGGAIATASTDMDALKGELTKVTEGLKTAFDTTLLGLLGSMVVQIVVTFRKRQEF